MAQIVTGIRSVLSNPRVYNLVQNLFGARKARRLIVSSYFPAHDHYRMLDIGCGTAEILEFLPETVEYYGFDASEDYIRQARQRFGHRGVFRAELVRNATLGDMPPFDLILAFGLLHHLDDDEATGLFELAASHLHPEGCLLTVDPVFCTGQGPVARWIIGKDRGQNIRRRDSYAGLAANHFEKIEAIERHDLLHIPYSHCILRCQKPIVRSP
ncbi:MAG: class I SAM-dependent methyltransferase [Caldilineae bacterium]|nr:MAG: class I SAM-dependent methyltransferase [Caldilineae bacterium]